MEYKYDVTLSFAGEDREYVDIVANVLRQNDIKVFYDKFEEVDLWGKDLGVHFDYVYRKGAKYCVPFISENYRKKIWTNHEIKTAIARAIETNVEYILPARFDDTEIDGIRPTLGFIDLRKLEPENFAHLIIKKLQKEPSIPLPEREQEKSDNLYLGVKVIAYNYNLNSVGLGITFTNTIKENRFVNEPYFELNNQIKKFGSNTFYLVDKLKDIEFPQKLEYGQSLTITYILKNASIDIWENMIEETKVQACITTSLGEKFKSNSIEISEIIKVFKEIIN